ncbi:hypothetical protein FRC01_005986 [Tulasnella sp. 417]|nr:hypothetical protein FRC01_005986 [Tulasnella sp. 417]
MASLALPDGATPHPPMLFRGQHLGQHDTEAEMPAGHEVNNPPRPWPGGTIQSPELEYRIPEEPIHQPASLSRRIIHKARLFFSAEGGDLRHTTWIFFRLAITLVQVSLRKTA